MAKFEWFLREYYNNTVKPPKIPGTLAVEVGGITRNALSADIEAAKSRKDIGTINLLGPERLESIQTENPST